MKTLKELRARLGEIKTEAQAILDAADEKNDGEFTDEQQEQFDALMAERDKVEASIERKRKVEEMEEPTGRRTPAQQPPSADVHHVREAVEDDPKRGFSNMADFAETVEQACKPGGEVDKRLRVLGAPTNFHRETGSSDGYMVPPAMREEIWQLVFQDEGLMATIGPEPTESNSVQLYADESTPWGSTGVQANWASEGSQFDPSRLTTDARNVQLHKLYAFVLATEELRADAPRLNNRLQVQAAQAIRYKAEEAIVNGDGVGKPLGWMKSGALVSQAKEGGQSADTITAANVAKMYSRLLMLGVRDPFWLINQDALPQLLTMTLGDNSVYMPPSSGFTQAPGGFLFGRPVKFSEYASTLGDKGDIQLVAPNGYYLTNKAGGIDFAASMHLYFDYDIEAFRWTFRLGGQPYLSAPVSPAKGSTTRSHFVTLAERS